METSWDKCFCKRTFQSKAKSHFIQASITAYCLTRLFLYSWKIKHFAFIIWRLKCYITINKDWQRNENNRNRFILLSTTHLLQLQWWFCLISILCVGESRTENQKPSDLFTNSFLPQDHGAERPLYKSEILLPVKKVGINWPKLRSIGAGLGEGLMVWLWKYLLPNQTNRSSLLVFSCSSGCVISLPPYPQGSRTSLWMGHMISNWAGPN
mgnify:CR=1 FL=1